MRQLTNEQIGLLRELKTDARWQGILDYIKEQQPEVRYKDDGNDEQAKIHRWIFDSGRSRENADILYILTLGA